MIKSLSINNIQSHEDTKLEFVDGINVIIGSSNQGKSAILRALYWVRTNRPLGIDNLASHWAVNDKGNLFKPMSVKVINDKGSVERRRTKDDNQYIVNGEVLNVVKTDVPEQVSSLLNLSDTNVQKQLDSPFLLSQTSGEVARYFNQIVNLDVIDKVLTNAETKRRKLKSTIESVEEDIERLEKDIEEFSWIDEVEDLIKSFNEVSSKKEVLINRCNDFYGEICKFEDNSERKDWFDEFVSERKPLINKIESSEYDLKELLDKIDKLHYSIESYNSVETYDFTTQKKWISRINIIRESFDNSKLDKLKSSIEDYKYQCDARSVADLKAIDYRKMLPKVCPLCGKPLEEDSCSSC